MIDHRMVLKKVTLVVQGTKEHLPETGTLPADVLGSCVTPLEGPATSSSLDFESLLDSHQISIFTVFSVNLDVQIRQGDL